MAATMTRRAPRVARLRRTARRPARPVNTCWVQLELDIPVQLSIPRSAYRTCGPKPVVRHECQGTWEQLSLPMDPPAPPKPPRRPDDASFHDVRDLMGFVRRLVQLRRATIDPRDRDDLTGWLFMRAIEMSGIRHGEYAYTPGQAPRGVFDPATGGKFSSWLGWQLPRRIIDWKRKEHGDSRYEAAAVRQATSLDGLIEDGGYDPHLNDDLTDQVWVRERFRDELDWRSIPV